MSNIEDDMYEIKRLQEFLIFYKNHGWIPNIDRTIDIEKSLQAIKNILSEREQDKARIKELEEERQLVGMPVRNKRSGKIGIVLHQWESRSIAVLENISPRVINTHDSWDTLEKITDEIKQTKTESDSIPKQKLKDKIDEINKKYEDSKDESGESPFFDPKFTIKTLKKLLQESEDK